MAFFHVPTQDNSAGPENLSKSVAVLAFHFRICKLNENAGMSSRSPEISREEKRNSFGRDMNYD